MGLGLPQISKRIKKRSKGNSMRSKELPESTLALAVVAVATPVVVAVAVAIAVAVDVAIAVAVAVVVAVAVAVAVAIVVIVVGQSKTIFIQTEPSAVHVPPPQGIAVVVTAVPVQSLLL